MTDTPLWDADGSPIYESEQERMMWELMQTGKTSIETPIGEITAEIEYPSPSVRPDSP